MTLKQNHMRFTFSIILHQIDMSITDITILALEIRTLTLAIGGGYHSETKQEA